MCPTYTLRNNNTGEEYEDFMSYSSLILFLQSNPNMEQIPTSVTLHSGRGMEKPDDSFRDILKEIKKKHSQGITKSTINTF